MKPASPESGSKSPIFINVAAGAKEWLLIRHNEQLQVVGAILTMMFLTAHEAGWSPRDLFTGDGELTQLNLKEFSFTDEEARDLSIALVAKTRDTVLDKSKELELIRSVIRFFGKGSFKIEQASRAGTREKGEGKGFAGLSSLTADDGLLEDAAAPESPVANPIGATHGGSASEGTLTAVVAAVAADVPERSRFSTLLVVGAIVCLIVFFIALASMSSGTVSFKAGANGDGAMIAAPPEKIFVAVAAASANIREKPTSRSRQLKVAHLGDNLEFLSVSDTFTQIRLADSTIGYIASELIVPAKDFERLKNLTAAQYLSLRAPEKRTEELFTKLQPMRDLFLATVGAVDSLSIDIKIDLQNLSDQPRLDMTLDSPAGILYSLSARSLVNAGKKDEALVSALAAVEADPTAVDYRVAYALLSYQSGIHDAVKGAASILPVLAPKTTNAWMIFGLSIAMNDSDQLDSAAVGSFVLALKLSKNPPVTRKYFTDLIKKSDKPRVQRLLAEALAEEAANPGVFGL